jgi:hypothetical protein
LSGKLKISHRLKGNENSLDSSFHSFSAYSYLFWKLLKLFRSKFFLCSLEIAKTRRKKMSSQRIPSVAKGKAKKRLCQGEEESLVVFQHRKSMQRQRHEGKIVFT